jgi:hypothetical protein
MVLRQVGAIPNAPQNISSVTPRKLEELARWQECWIIGDGLQETVCSLTNTEKS